MARGLLQVSSKSRSPCAAVQAHASGTLSAAINRGTTPHEAAAVRFGPCACQQLPWQARCQGGLAAGSLACWRAPRSAWALPLPQRLHAGEGRAPASGGKYDPLWVLLKEAALLEVGLGSVAVHSGAVCRAASPALR